MKISIVTLSFNQRAFLRQALESVLNQSYPDLEYIVIDPGSTDGSRELLAEYEAKGARLILEPDTGPADGLNKGFRASSGSVMGFLNADDVILPGALQHVAEFFDKHAGCDLVMGDGFIIDEHGRRLRHIRSRAFTVDRYLHGGAQWLQQSVFFRRDAYEAVGGFNPENRTCWDGELFLQMARRGVKVEYLHRDLACFRLHGTSITSQIQDGGGRPQVLAYQRDCNRVFETAMGRPWSKIDSIKRELYRAERVLFAPKTTLLGKIASRFR